MEVFFFLIKIKTVVVEHSYYQTLICAKEISFCIKH